MGGVLWRYHHHPEQVIPLYQESIMLFQDLKDVRGKAHPLVMLAEAERSQGDFARSHKHFRETLVLEKELGLHDSLVFFALAGIGSLVANYGQLDRAARLLGTVNAALESGSYNTRLALLEDVFDTMVADVRTQHNKDAF